MFIIIIKILSQKKKLLKSENGAQKNKFAHEMFEFWTKFHRNLVSGYYVIEYQYIQISYLEY